MKVHPLNVLITGGCGFIGCNAADRMRSQGHHVTVLDDLSRLGAARNLEWLRARGGVEFARGDIRDGALLAEVIGRGGFDVVIHLAAQVAVTKSVQAPRLDFEVNALGTLNVLEAVRLHNPRTIVLNASTNKVYGKLQQLAVAERPTRYEFSGPAHGVSEEHPLDFHSPYGCSKGAAEQYVIDYARIYGLKTVNFRQSCIYGYRQFGVEDQGWVAWFMIAHTLGRPITIYGTGKQVRDLLFIDDLVNCYLRAIERIDAVAGMTFNIGGGPSNATSLVEFLDRLAALSGRPARVTFADWRQGDQLVYVSDIRKAQAKLDWRPGVDVQEGVRRLYEWVTTNQDLFSSLSV